MTANHEGDGTPLVLRSEGWERLPDGRQQLLLRCNTPVDYATMPKVLNLGRFKLFKASRDSDRKVALFRERGGDGRHPI